MLSFTIAVGVCQHKSYLSRLLPSRFIHVIVPIYNPGYNVGLTSKTYI